MVWLGWSGSAGNRRRDSFQNVDIAFGLPRRTADEQAVYMRLADQFGGIAGIDAAAIKHRRLSAEPGGGDLLDQRLLLVGIVGAGRNTVFADGPDRFVGEQDFCGKRVASQALQRAQDLRRQHLVGATS